MILLSATACRYLVSSIVWRYWRRINEESCLLCDITSLVYGWCLPRQATPEGSSAEMVASSSRHSNRHDGNGIMNSSMLFVKRKKGSSRTRSYAKKEALRHDKAAYSRPGCRVSKADTPYQWKSMWQGLRGIRGGHMRINFVASSCDLPSATPDWQPHRKHTSIPDQSENYII